MNVDHPTVVLHFVFAFNYCRLSVYARDEQLAREVLEGCGVREWLESAASNNWHEMDTRMLLDLTRTALPKMLERRMPKVSTLEF